MPESTSDLVQKLHESLTVHPQLDPSTREALERLVGEIRDKLSSESQQGDEAASTDTLSGRIQSFMEDYEAQNPQITKMLAMVAERLADMGI